MAKSLSSHRGAHSIDKKLERPRGSVSVVSSDTPKEYYAVELYRTSLSFYLTDKIAPTSWNADPTGITPPPYQNDYIFENYWDAYAYYCKLKKLMGDEIK